MSSSSITTLRKNWLSGWNELTRKSLVDLEEEWLTAEVGRDNVNSSNRLSLHYQFMREFLGIDKETDTRVEKPLSYNDLLTDFVKNNVGELIDYIPVHVVNAFFTLNSHGWQHYGNWRVKQNVCYHNTGNTSILNQVGFAFVQNDSYRATYEVVGRTAGTVQMSLAATPGTVRSTNGIFTETIVAGATQTIGFTPSSDFDGGINMVRIEKIGPYIATIPELWDDMQSLAFQALGPRLDGTISIEPQRGTGSATFTRADGTTNITHVRDFENLYKTVPQNEARIQGARRVENFTLYSEDFDNAAWTTSNGNTIGNTTDIPSPNGTQVGKASYLDDAGNRSIRQVSTTPIVTGRTFVWSFYMYWPSSNTSSAWYAQQYTNVDFSSVINLATIGRANPNRWIKVSIPHTYTTGTNPYIVAELHTNSNSDVGDYVYFTEPQLEEVNGQTNQAHSEYVATETTPVTKYFWKENQSEVADNLCAYSYDLSSWTGGTAGAATLDAVGIFGEPNTASTLVDDSVSAQESRYQDDTVANDSSSYTIQTWIRKKSSPDPTDTRAGVLSQLILGSTSVNQMLSIDLYSGYTEKNTYFDGTFEVEDHGDWWVLIQHIDNNSTGNTVLRTFVYAALVDDFGGVSAQQTIVVGHVQKEKRATHSTTPVVTNGSAVTNVVGTKTKQWEQTQNLITDSEDLVGWSATGSCLIRTIDDYVRVEDNDASNVSSRRCTTLTSILSSNTNFHVWSFLLRKQSTSPAYFPQFTLAFTGGVTQAINFHVDPATGNSAQYGGTGTRFGYVQNHSNNYWKVVIGLQSDSANTTVTPYIYPAASATLGGAGVAAGTGYVEVKNQIFSLNRTLPYKSHVITEGSAITLGKQKDLDTDLHPTSYKLGAKVFKRYDKWVTATAYSVGDYIIPATGSGPSGGNGYYYQCVVAGTTGGSEPTFGTTIGDGTYDNGVVWKCMGKATVAGYLAEPARTNSITNSYNLTTWTQTGTAVSALDAVGIDGVNNHATTLTDDDGAGYEYVSRDITVANDSNTHCGNFFIKKDNDTSRYVGLDLQLSVGTVQSAYYDLDTQNGTVVLRTGTGTYNAWVEDHGDWWKVVITLANNTTGNTTLTARIYPAVGTVQGTASTAATGSCIVGHAQVELNTSVPSSPILTTGAADARAGDTLVYANSNLPLTLGSAYAAIWYPVDAANLAGNPRFLASELFPTSVMMSLATAAGNSLISMWDGVTSESSPLNLVEATPNLAAVRWNASLNEKEAVSNGSASGTPSSFSTWALSTDPDLQVGFGDATIDGIGCVSDVIIYNKDLGSIKLESMTAYD